MTYQRFILNVAVLLMLTGLGLGASDESRRIAEIAEIAEMNMTLSEFSDKVPQSVMNADIADLGAPPNVSSDAGSDVALFTNKAPSKESTGKLLSSQIQSNPPKFMYFNGKYMSWNDFINSFPGSHPGLWIQRTVSWSMYATLPLDGWTQEMIYLPAASPVYMYEIHPNGFASAYNLGYHNQGFYTLWYLADEPGRHICMIATGSGHSNQAIIDVY